MKDKQLPIYEQWKKEHDECRKKKVSLDDFIKMSEAEKKENYQYLSYDDMAKWRINYSMPKAIVSGHIEFTKEELKSHRETLLKLIEEDKNTE